MKKLLILTVLGLMLSGAAGCRFMDCLWRGGPPTQQACQPAGSLSARALASRLALAIHAAAAATVTTPGPTYVPGHTLIGRRPIMKKLMTLLVFGTLLVGTDGLPRRRNAGTYAWNSRFHPERHAPRAQPCVVVEPMRSVRRRASRPVAVAAVLRW